LHPGLAAHLSISDARLTFCDVAAGLRSNDQSNAPPARIAGALEAALVVAAGGMHPTEEEIPLGPGMHVLA
jgi:hypothetical protein